MREFKVYDDVWVMRNNRPERVMIYSVEESMNHWKNGVEKSYKIVHGKMSADTPNNPAFGYSANKIFRSRSDLIKELSTIYE